MHDTSAGNETRPQGKWVQRLEVAAGAILSIAVVATSWSSYQAARWSGVQMSEYVKAGGLRVQSTQAAITAEQLRATDLAIFMNWLDANANNNSKLEAFYRERFRSEFVPAFEAWIALRPRTNPDAPPSPFAMQEYKLELSERADELALRAEEKFEQGQVANQQSDDYVLAAVLLSAVLFFSGIAHQFNSVFVRGMLLLVSVGIGVLAIFRLVTYPIA